MFITKNITIGRKKSNNSSPFVLPRAIPIFDIEPIKKRTYANRHKASKMKETISIVTYI